VRAAVDQRSREICWAYSTCNEGRFTIIFDLEETLTHVSEKVSGADAYIPVVTQDKRSLKLGVHYRPFLKDSLQRLKSLNCELIIWASGTSECSNKIINSIDPDNELFDMRLFRDQCYISPKGLFVKDIRMINRDLDRCIIVDNNAYSFGFQLENGVLVLPFTGGSGDTELLTLTEYLSYLTRLEDFRPFNKRHFKYELYEKETTVDSLLKKLTKP
jgi:CTD small phosphatase-like protein 2